jgi:hypothetical protein
LALAIVIGGVAAVKPAHAQTYSVWHNLSTGYCLGVAAGNVTNGTAIIVWPCNGNSDQKWTNIGDALPYPAGTFFSSRNGTNNNKCLGVAGGSGSNGAALIIWDCFGTSHTDQYWEAIPVGNGCYVWYNAYSNKVMGVQGGSTSQGASVIQWDYLSHPDQQWCPG